MMDAGFFSRASGYGWMLSVIALAPCAMAAESPLICFGNEPSWGLHLTEPGVARLQTPDEPGVDYQGGETRLDVIRERIWRGKPTTGQGGDLVAFLSDAACSDQMSDTVHPVTARVSLGDGRFLAGCCRVVAAATGSAVAAAPPAASIEGPIWRLVELRGLAPSALAGGEQPATARFRGGRIDGFSGCNRFFGGYTLEGDRVVIGQMAGSMMMCPEPAMTLEHAVTSGLAGTFRYTVTGDRLILRAGDEPILTFQAEPPPRLEGVTWEVTGFNNGRQAVVSTLAGTALSLTFKDGAVSGTAGCNTFHAPYTATADSIVVGLAAVTRRACLGEGVAEQEQAFLAALQSATKWTFEGGMLDMHRADGERVLTASPRAE